MQQIRRCVHSNPPQARDADDVRRATRQNPAMSSIALWTLALRRMLVGVPGLGLAALPGIPLMYAGMVVAAAIDDFQRIGWITLGVLGFLTVLSVVIEFAASALGAKQFGASKRAIWGAL